MTLQATETLQNGPFQGIFDEAGAFVGFLNPRANGADLRIGGYAPVSGSFTTLTVSGQASFADGTAAAPSVKIGDEQNGLYSDGAGSLSFATAGARVVRMGTVGGTGNYLRLDANNTPLITAVAGATNADIGLASAGTGAILLATNGSIATTQVRVSHVASAVNYWDFTGAATGNGIRVDATGSDSGVNGFFVAKGSGVWNFCTSGSSSNRQFQIGHIASAVNYIQATGAATGAAPSFAVGGSDTNIDLALTPKGTGVLRYGTHSALAAETVTGYITIKDAAGNSRKLAVVS